MKVLIVGGFLGSGKTSLILQLAAYMVRQIPSEKEIKVVIVENEIGETAIDANTLITSDLQVRNLFAGCACCTLAGETADTLHQIRQTADPEWVILEASGVAIPSGIRRMLEEIGLWARTCTLVDATRWQRIKEPLRYILEPQLEDADVICLNKTEGLEPLERQEIEQELATKNRKAVLCSVSLLEPAEETVFAKILGESYG